MKKIILFLFFGFLCATPVFATEISDCYKDSNVDSCLQKLVDEYTKKVGETQAQKKTLADEIKIADNKVYLTNIKIAAGEKKIVSLSDQIASVSGKIGSIENSLDRTSQILVHRIEATYIAGRTDPVMYLLSSSGFSDLVARLEFLQIAQKHDKILMEQMAVSKRNYHEQKDLLADKKKQVEAAKAQLEQDKKALGQLKAAKQVLLEDTKNSEVEYQRLLSQAKAQLAAFNSFVASQGGSGLLQNQTKCDDWGCYYNQRDSKWGSIALNNTKYTLADSGCLITSMAMVITHFGYKDVNPLSIIFNPLNFASYEPAYLNKEIYAGGKTWTRENISYSQIDAELSSGKAVVIGIGKKNYPPDHFLVFVSGSNGNYIMNDPYTENGNKISFTSKYSIGGITSIERVRQK